MAKRSVKSRKRATRKSPASKAKAGRKTTTKKRTTAKRRATPKAKAGRKTTKKRTTAKRRATPKAKAGRKTTKKRTTAKRRATPKAKAGRKTTRKRTTAKRRATPKAKAGRKTTRKRTTAKRHATPKAKAGRKTTRKRTTAKRHATPKAKAGRKTTTRKRTTAKRHATPKAKAGRKTTRKRTTAKRHATPKVKASTKPTARKRTTAKKSVTPKARATRKPTAPKRVTARKQVTPKAETTRKPTKKVAQRRRSPVTPKGEFDFNAWLLPRLDLEQYEPHIELEPGIKSQNKGSTRYAWIGAGQCGGRIAKSFYDLGYKKVLAVNTTHHDLDLLDIPQDQKFLMDMGEKGAGKDMDRGKNAVQQYQQEVLHLTRQTFGAEVDHIMVCFGAGGGTGGGSAPGLIEVSKRYARYIGLPEPDKKVGVIMTLPSVGEASSPKVAENAWKVATELSELAAAGQISPLIFVDNDKINKMYPGMTVRSFWPSINSTVTGLFDIFNRLSALSSRYTSFDPVDYHSIMEAGGCAIMGLTKVLKFQNKFAISQAVKKNLEKTLLAGGFDLTTARLAGCVVVAGRKLIASIKGLQDNIDYAFDNLSEITGEATIHRGIYEDGRESLRVYTIIGGLDTCTSRLEDLKSRITVEVSS